MMLFLYECIGAWHHVQNTMIKQACNGEMEALILVRNNPSKILWFQMEVLITHLMEA